MRVSTVISFASPVHSNPPLLFTTSNPHTSFATDWKVLRNSQPATVPIFPLFITSFIFDFSSFHVTIGGFDMHSIQFSRDAAFLGIMRLLFLASSYITTVEVRF